ncbi:hypothetical protein [Catenulispora sp. GAS73]|uniref:hypothetical protein n=1 Tax=Catenulispora sp. GAS73 TaxID=3156269 RepID=UPI00351733D4
MRAKVSVGVGAWIVGATTATGLSLFAVSYLGDAPHNPQGDTLSVSEVNRALASATATPDGSSADSAPPGPAGTSPVRPTPSDSASGTSSGTPSGLPSTGPAASNTAPSSTAGSHPWLAPTGSTGSTAAHTVERRLSVDGGSVLAQCQGSAAYLVSWSPAQGYLADGVQRGPARFATVVFVGAANRMEVRVACPAGTPALVGDDDGGFDH